MKIIRVLNLISLLAAIAVNGLANALPINNIQTGAVSDSFGALFTPAGYVFAIWGVIYLTLAVFAVYQVLPAQKNNTRLDRLGPWFILANLFNGAWIFAWHYEKLPLSLFIMIVLLVSLIQINIAITDLKPGFIKAVFGVYLGWICIATIANVTALLVNYNWNGFGISQETWSVIMIIAGAIITTLTIIKLKNPYTGLAVMWAFTGIIIKQYGDHRMIVVTAIIGIVVSAIFSVTVLIQQFVK